MQDNKIQIIAEELQRVNAMLASYIQKQVSSYDDKLFIWLFFKNNSEVNSIINWIEELPENMLFEIETSAKNLVNTTSVFTECYKANKGILAQFELKPEFDGRLSVLEEDRDRKAQASILSRQEYYALSNRLDFMSLYDPEYRALDKRCDELNAKRKEAECSAKNAYDAFEKFRRMSFGYENFNINWLYVLVSQLAEIANTLLSGINGLKKHE